MRVKALITLKSKLSRSCNRFASVFRFRLKKPVFIGALVSRFRHTKPRQPPEKRPSTLLSCLCLVKRKEQKKHKMSAARNSSFGVSEAKLLQSPVTPAKKLFPSPITPAYVSTKKTSQMNSFADEVVEDACRSFENYLIHLVVEEGKVEDLMDIEELLYCWKNLKSPVFVDLVSRFYGELCRDLFSGEEDQ
ncbi:PREDICTED: transcription repressor OFP17 [Tarenaya hassleriana]|uniref:transcription repressor OFP17 n=1 Tax=Tarenaya hassleriana TaxID=28532 RepID=UPI00053C6E8D|nr:PREDICTED: transcription repressor OFP17 [Tarenaya hassleriana]